MSILSNHNSEPQTKQLSIENIERAHQRGRQLRAESAREIGIAVRSFLKYAWRWAFDSKPRRQLPAAKTC